MTPGFPVAWLPAGRLPGTPPGFTERAAALLAHPGRTPGELTGTVAAAAALTAETRGARSLESMGLAGRPREGNPHARIRR